MNDLLEFLTSKEIVVVYIVVGVACFLCFVIYLLDKNYYKRKRRQNTRELNRLVEDINLKIEEEQMQEPKEVVVESISQEVKEVEEPILQKIEELSTVDNVTIEGCGEKVEENVIEQLEPVVVNDFNDSVDKVENIVLDAMSEDGVVEELTYTDIEPNRQQAQAELEKLTVELEKAEQETKNIDLTAYEEEQEENAIISLEELVKKSKEMYAANEISQYADEGNEPISLADLELRKQESIKEEPVIIEMIPDNFSDKVVEVHQERMVLDDFNNIKLEEKPIEVKPIEVKPAYQSTKKFKSSPVISPIYGIERKETSADIELENTANYEKLDEEIKKTNEFLMTLRELQKHLD